MSGRYPIVAARIGLELGELQRVVERCQRAMTAAKADAAHQDMFLDSVALNLHDFYTGIERTLQHIATLIDGTLPAGVQWHKELLQQMQVEVPNLRPRVVSTELVECLQEYLAFRHVVRSVYAFKFDPIRLEHLVQRLEHCYTLAKKELLSFAEFLNTLGKQ